jgi:predicted dehydrogenase
MRIKMENILIIGAGQLGSRHLQGLVQSRLALNVTVVDPASESLALAKLRANEIIFGNQETNISYLQEIKEGVVFDLAIIATTANVRFRVFQNLISKCSVKNIIFEKVLFQKEEEYIEVEKLLASNNISAWVNCPRRVFPVYKSLKTLLKNEANFNISVKGDNWGLACNGIHFIDLFSYLTGNSDYHLDRSFLNKKAIDSKRNGFFEVNGTLHGQDDFGNSFNLTCTDEQGITVNVSIITPNFEIVIKETDGQVLIKHNGQEHKEPYVPIYQSQLTFLNVEEIVELGSSSLTSFSESKSIHLPFIRSIKQHIGNSLKEHLDGCPIT